MHVICLLSQKGGAGKSTVVQSLAVCALQHGKKTLIVELDPQGTLKDWYNRRSAEHPKVHQTLPQSIGEVLKEARDDGVDWVFIDTPGHHNPAAVAAAPYADIILIPCKILSKKDVDAILPTITEAEHSNKPTFVVMNQVPPNAPKLVRQRQLSIQKHYNIKVLSLYLSRRADFEYCDAQGLSAAEFNPEGAAAVEIEKLYVLLQSLLIIAKQDTQPRVSTPAPIELVQTRRDNMEAKQFLEKKIERLGDFRTQLEHIRPALRDTDENMRDVPHMEFSET